MRNFPGTERSIFGFAIVDIFFRSVMVKFSLLRASDYCKMKGPVGYILTLYNQYSYGELSILLLFILSPYTPSLVSFADIAL